MDSQTDSAAAALRGLGFHHLLAVEVTDHEFGNGKDHRKGSSHPERSLEERNILASKQVVRADTHDEKSGKNVRCADNVQKHQDSVRLRDNGPEISKLSSAVSDHISDRVLHPGVCHQYPICR